MAERRESVNHALQHIRERVSDARANGIAADLGTAIGADAVVRQLPEVHILVNNLGIYEATSFEKTDDAMWSRLFEVNVLSGVRLSRHFLPLMKRKNGAASCSFPANRPRRFLQKNDSLRSN